MCSCNRDGGLCHLLGRWLGRVACTRDPGSCDHRRTPRGLPALMAPRREHTRLHPRRHSLRALLEGNVPCRAALLWMDSSRAPRSHRGCWGCVLPGGGKREVPLVAARAKLEDGRMLCLHNVLHTLMASLDPSELSVLDCPAEGAGAGFLDILKLTG